MKVFVMTQAASSVIDQNRIQENVEEVLNSGAVYATLEGAKAAAQEDLDDLYAGDDRNLGEPKVVWEQPLDTHGREIAGRWIGCCGDLPAEAGIEEDEKDDQTYLIRELEVLP